MYAVQPVFVIENTLLHTDVSQGPLTDADVMTWIKEMLQFLQDAWNNLPAKSCFKDFIKSD